MTRSARRAPRRAIVLAAVAGLLPTAAPRAAAVQDGDGALAVVYVEANVGGASGGHVALRAGELAYHYQFEGELVALVREEWPAFVRRYALLENRPLHLAWLDVAPADAERVADHLARLHVEQLLRLDARDRAAADVAWLEALAGTRPVPALRGLGLLAEARESPSGRALRSRIAAELGDGYLSRRARELDASLAGWAGGRHASGEPGPTSTAAPDLERLRELLTEREAVAALREARGVADEALVAAGDAPLGVAECAALERLHAACVANVLELLVSPRPDRGAALLVALARAHAAARSLDEGRLLVLDPFPDDAARASADSMGSPAERAAMAARADALIHEVRDAVLVDAPALAAPDAAPFVGEAGWRLLEECAARRADLLAATQGADVRDARGRLVPARGRAPSRLPTPPEAGALAAWTAAARREAARVDAALLAAFRYDLFDRNCVTELAQALNDAFDDDPARLDAALGGAIRPHDGATFVPFVYFDEVCAGLRVAAREDVPSHRQAELARMYAEGPDALVYAREANTLTSTAYARRAKDGSFLLFTDDVVWARPAYGAVNLAWGLGSAMVGLLAAPFDDGERATAGLRGVLFSLPELGFGNIRKGSYADVPPTD